MALLACGWRHTVAVGRAGEVYSWGRGVNGQLGHGTEVDEFTPKQLQQLCKGTASVNALRATATALGGYVAPADRYAVVPNGEDLMEVPGSGADAELYVPGQAADSSGVNGTGSGRTRPAGDDGDGPAAKKAHTLPAAGSSVDDAAVPGS